MFQLISDNVQLAKIIPSVGRKVHGLLNRVEVVDRICLSSVCGRAAKLIGNCSYRKLCRVVRCDNVPGQYMAVIGSNWLESDAIKKRFAQQQTI